MRNRSEVRARTMPRNTFSGRLRVGASAIWMGLIMRDAASARSHPPQESATGFPGRCENPRAAFIIRGLEGELGEEQKGGNLAVDPRGKGREQGSGIWDQNNGDKGTLRLRSGQASGRRNEGSCCGGPGVAEALTGDDAAAPDQKSDADDDAVDGEDGEAVTADPGKEPLDHAERHDE